MRIGISKPSIECLWDFRWLKAFAVSEWDFSTILGLNSRERKQVSRHLTETHHRTILSAGAGFFPADPAAEEKGLPIAILERLELASEMAQFFATDTLLLRVPTRFENHPTVFRELSAYLPKNLGLALDPGSAHFRIDTPRASWVADPLWHPPSFLRKKSIFKVHGWHESRWIRYYGPLQLEKLRTVCKKMKPGILLFGHSKREEEAATFLQA